MFIVLATIAILVIAACCQTENQNSRAEPIHMRKAPMLDCDNLEEGFSVVPGEFFVYLHPGHSFKHHNHVVGTDMTPYVLEFWDKWYPGQVVYTCEGVEDDLLASIRNDPGVDGVECVIEPGGIPSEEPDTLRHSALTNEFVEL